MPHLNKTRANMENLLDNNMLDTVTRRVIVYSANLSGEIDHAGWELALS